MLKWLLVAACVALVAWPEMHLHVANHHYERAPGIDLYLLTLATDGGRMGPYYDTEAVAERLALPAARLYEGPEIKSRWITTRRVYYRASPVSMLYGEFRTWSPHCQQRLFWRIARVRLRQAYGL